MNEGDIVFLSLIALCIAWVVVAAFRSNRRAR
jgi:hypothetical protein